jgi:hypothetical protein
VSRRRSRKPNTSDLGVVALSDGEDVGAVCAALPRAARTYRNVPGVAHCHARGRRGGDGIASRRPRVALGLVVGPVRVGWPRHRKTRCKAGAPCCSEIRDTIRTAALGVAVGSAQSGQDPPPWAVDDDIALGRPSNAQVVRGGSRGQPGVLVANEESNRGHAVERTPRASRGRAEPTDDPAGRAVGDAPRCL